jgi:hypothetical protein
MEQMGLNCFSLNELEGIRRLEFEPGITCRTLQFPVNFRSIPVIAGGKSEAKNRREAGT